MSLASAIAARFSSKSERELELEGRVKELEDEVERLRRAREIVMARPAGPDFRSLLNRMPPAQCQAQNAQYAAMQTAQYANQQYPGMQGLQQGWRDCTCVPGRAAAFGVRS